MNIDTIITDAINTFTGRLWSTNINAFYGRIFRNENNDNISAKIKPLIATANNEYIDVLKDTSKDAICFFDVLPNIEMTGWMEKNTIRIMFMVNLSKLYPTYTRIQATEAAKKAVYNILSCVFDKVDSCVTGYTSFSDYEWNEAVVSDMSPHYLFRYDCTSFNTNC